MELRDFLAPLLRWWWLLITAAVIAAGFSYIVVRQQPPLYQAKATLLIGSAFQDPNPGFDQLYSSSQLITTYVDISYRDPVKDAVKKNLGMTWLPGYTVSAIPNTQLIEIRVTDTDPARVQAVANELANQLILQSPTNQSDDLNRQEFINEELDQIEVAIRESQSEIDAKRKELANLTSARQISDLQNQIYSLQTKLDTLRDNYTGLLASTERGAMNTVSLIEAAKLPTYPIGPNGLTPILTAAALAITLAGGAAYLLAYLDNTLKSPEEIKKVTGLPMLVGIPQIEGEGYGEKLITVKQPRSPISEAYRTLRTAVQFSTIDRPECKTILVSSANPSEGKSITTANLAAVIAQAGYRVLVVDADLRRPVMHKIFGVDNRSGLTEFLRVMGLQEGDNSFDAMLTQLTRPSTVENLSVLTSGPIPPNPSELLGSRTTQSLITALKNHFDYIVLDSPPTLIVTDAVVLSAQADGVILVIDADRTQRSPRQTSCRPDERGGCECFRHRGKPNINSSGWVYQLLLSLPVLPQQRLPRDTVGQEDLEPQKIGGRSYLIKFSIAGENKARKR